MRSHRKILGGGEGGGVSGQPHLTSLHHSVFCTDCFAARYNPCERSSKIWQYRKSTDEANATLSGLLNLVTSNKAPKPSLEALRVHPVEKGPCLSRTAFISSHSCPPISLLLLLFLLYLVPSWGMT